MILEALSEHLIPGRWQEIRRPSEIELQQTLVVGIPIREASAKIRTGPPRDDEEDYACILPLQQTAAAPIPDPRLLAGVSVPSHVVNYMEHGAGARSCARPD